jgi:hypothetical protein
MFDSNHENILLWLQQLILDDQERVALSHKYYTPPGDLSQAFIVVKPSIFSFSRELSGLELDIRLRQVKLEHESLL